MTRKIRIGALISGTGSNLQAILDACEKGAVAGRVEFVGSDNPNAAGLERGNKYGISTFSVNYGDIIRAYHNDPAHDAAPADFDLDEIRSKQTLFSVDNKVDPDKVTAFLTTRAIAEARLLKEMSAYPFDLLVLAGFMRTLTPYFIDRVNTTKDEPRIMNIHPALLPFFPGIDGYGDTFRYGCKVAGCTVHFIDYGEDSGPIIGQRAFSIQFDDTLETVRKKGLAQEWELYPECLHLFAQGRLKTVKVAYESRDGKRVEKTVVRILPE